MEEIKSKVIKILESLKNTSHSTYFGVGKAAGEDIDDGYYRFLKECNILDSDSIKKFKYNFNILPNKVHVSEMENGNKYILEIENVNYTTSKKEYINTKMFIFYMESLPPEPTVTIDFFLIHKDLPRTKGGGYYFNLLASLRDSRIYYLEFNESDYEIFQKGNGLFTKKAL